MNCYDYETGQTLTDGTKVIARKCYCGTTACLVQNAPRSNQFGETRQNGEMTKEEEHNFYRKVLHSKLLCEDKNCDICTPSLTPIGI